MKKHYLLVVGLSLAVAFAGQAQDFQRELNSAAQRKDTAASGQVLRRWYLARPRDPEFYIARFNLLLKQAEAIELKSGTGRAGSLAFKDKNGQVAGHLGTGYLSDKVEQACAVLKQGLTIAPERLDMWFGLAKTYEITYQPAEEVATLTQALSTHAANKKEWLWRQVSTLTGLEEEFLPSALEEYAEVYWQQPEPAALETGRQLTELILKYYPQSSLGPFNMGAYYGIKGENRQAYAYLQQADKLQPNDPTNVANLANLAIELGQPQEAAAYVARLGKYPDTADAVKDLKKKLKQRP